VDDTTRRNAVRLAAAGAASGLTALSSPVALGQEARTDRMICHYRSDTLRIPDYDEIKDNKGKVLRIVPVLYIVNTGPKQDGGEAPFDEPYHWVPICSIQVCDLRDGDVISIFAECETTSQSADPRSGKRKYSVQFGSFVGFSDDETDMSKVYYGGKLICRAAGMCVTPDMHHLLTTRVGSIKIGKDFPGGKWLHFVGYADSDARKNGDFLIADLGHLSVVQYRA
jgi:hypothetical protein